MAGRRGKGRDRHKRKDRERQSTVPDRYKKQGAAEWVTKLSEAETS